MCIVLVQFSFENFKSFRDKVTLDLSAADLSAFPERVVSINNEQILPLSIIYGANASGKSNVFQAFKYMSNYVIHSFKYGDEEEEFEEIKPTPFLFDNQSLNKQSYFEVYFSIPFDAKETIYQYGFCLDNDGVSEEWLNVKYAESVDYQVVFYRGKDEVDFSGFTARESQNIQIALEKQVLVVSLGAKLKVGVCKIIRDWFLGNSFADFGDILTNFYMSHRIPKSFVEDKQVQQNVIDFLATFDSQIHSFEIEPIPQEDDNHQERFRINTLHQLVDEKGEYALPLTQESSGTLKMFSLYPDLSKVLTNGSVFFVDELNSRLHPLLVRNIMLIFLNPKLNKNHAQLVITTHDSWQLSKKLLRKDEIWFVDKDNRGISTLYSLVDFIDDDDNLDYDENYLVGKYGAIPNLKQINFFKE